MNWIARIIMGLLGLAFLAGLLMALVIYTVFATVRWLLTGRKPQVVMVWQHFSGMRRNFQTGRYTASSASTHEGRAATDGHVVDVQAREIVDDAPRLPMPKQ